VKEGTALFRLVEVDPVKLRGLAPEEHAAEIEVGQKVRVNVEAYAEDFWGKVSRINPQVDQASRTFHIEVVIPNPKRLLKPGGFAKALVQTQVDSKVVCVSQKAVAWFAGVSKVYVMRGGKAAEVPVETGRRLGEYVEIVKGLSGDEAIIISSVNRLANGVAVVVGERGRQ
jgi:RND family efflux transporter MFP subunit